MSVKGHVAKQPENGHRLHGKYDDLYEVKPGNFRFMVFRHGNEFFITNGAPKKLKGKQDEDYAIALQLRKDFLASQGGPRLHK